MPGSPLTDTPSPLAYDDFAPIDKFSRAAAADESAGQRFEQLNKKRDAMGSAREAELTARSEALDKTLSRPHTEYPGQQAAPEPPKPEDYHKYSMAWVGAMAAFGAFAGKKMRGTANASIKAFAAAVNGWQEGNLQAYKEAAEHWKDQTARIIQMNKQRLDEYRAILEDRSLTVEEQMMKYKLAATKWEDRIAWDAASANNAAAVGQHFTVAAESSAKAEQTRQQLVDIWTQENETAVERANQRQRWMATPQGAKEFERLSPGQQVQMRAFIDRYADKPSVPFFDPASPGGFPFGAGTPGTEEAPMEMPAAEPAGTATRLPADLRGPMPAHLKSMDMAARQFRIESYQAGKGEPSSADWAMFDRQHHAARSAQGLALQEFIESNPGATAEQIIEFQARQANAVAALRAAGAREGGIAVGVAAFNRSIAPALAASEAVPRAKWVAANTLRNNIRLQTSDPAYQRFYNANEAAITEYAMAIGRGSGMTVFAQERAKHILDTAKSPEAYKAGMEQLKIEVEQISQAPGDAREELLRSLFPKAPGTALAEPPGKTAPAPAPAPGGDDGFGELTVH